MKTPRMNPPSLVELESAYGNRLILPSRRRYIWWVQILIGAVWLLTPAVVFNLTGGDVHHLTDGDTPTAPTLAAGVVFFALAAVAGLVEFEATRTSRHNFDAWFAYMNPDLIPGVPEMVQALLWERGPMTAPQIWHLLAGGGDWGPAAVMAEQALVERILEPNGVPAHWLAPREHGDPYTHLGFVEERDREATAGAGR